MIIEKETDTFTVQDIIDFVVRESKILGSEFQTEVPHFVLYVGGAIWFKIWSFYGKLLCTEYGEDDIFMAGIPIRWNVQFDDMQIELAIVTHSEHAKS